MRKVNKQWRGNFEHYNNIYNIRFVSITNIVRQITLPEKVKQIFILCTIRFELKLTY